MKKYFYLKIKRAKRQGNKAHYKAIGYKAKLLLQFILLPVSVCVICGLVYAQSPEILVGVGRDTIRDGEWFGDCYNAKTGMIDSTDTVTIKTILPLSNELIYLKAIPAYKKDSLLMDSLDLFPRIVQLNATGVWTGQLFFKNKKKRPKDEWIKIQATYYGSPGAVDSSKTIFARYGPFASSNKKDQIRIIPNPIGALGLPAEITIWRKGVIREGSEVKIFDSFGHLVRDLSKDVMKKVNERLPNKMPIVVDSLDLTLEFSTLYTTWDGRNDRGAKVANGVYQLCVKTIETQEAAIWKEKIGVIW